MNEDDPVIRINTTHGSHIEPPLDPDWTDLTKLQWHAAVVTYDTGIPIRISDGAYKVQSGDQWVDVPGHYSINVGSGCRSALDYRDAWIYLSGVSAGYEAAKEQQA